MQAKQRVISIVLAFVVILGAVAMMAGLFSTKVEPGSQSVRPEYKGKTQEVVLEAIARFERVPATVVAKQNTLVSSRVLAQIKRLTVRAGDRVQRGDLLIELDGADFRAQVSQAEAQLEAISAQLTQAERQYKRTLSLREQGLVSVSDLDDAKARYDSLVANKLAVEQQLAQSKVALDYTRIKAPLSGTVVERLAEPGDTAAPGVALLSLYNPAQLQVEAAVREQQAVRLKVGDSLMIEIDALGSSERALISEIVPVADSNARSFIVKLDISQAQQLMPGMYARVLLPEPAKQGVLVDASLLTKYGQLDMLYVVENGAAVRRFVRLGEIQQDGRVEVVSGLRPGEVMALNDI